MPFCGNHGQTEPTLLAIFSVALPSASEAEKTLEAVEALSVEDTNSAITNAVVATPGYQGNNEVTGKEATVSTTPELSSGTAAVAASLYANLRLALLLLLPCCSAF